MAALLSNSLENDGSPLGYEATNGQIYEDSSDEEPEARMRVGEMYQALVPDWQEDSPKKIEGKNTFEGMRIWSPFHEVPDEKVEAYCKIAKEKHGYNVEQALGLLFWHSHDIEKSLKDMANFTPMPDDWSVEDKVLFEQAYTFHGKSFRRIQQLLPDKEISQLVKHYYLWKKTRTKTSLMDRQARKLSKQSNSDDSDGENTQFTYLQSKSAHDAKLGNGDTGKENDSEIKHKLPKGIKLDLKGLSDITSFPGGADKYLKKLENDITILKSQIQVDKQHWSLLCQEMKGAENYQGVKPMQSPVKEEKESSHIWSNQELLLAVQGVRRYGKDFQAISEVLGSKSAAQVKTFFVSQRRRFNLDQVLREYEEAEAGSREDQEQTDDLTAGAMQTDAFMEM